MILERGDKSWCELPFDMETLGSFERSGLQTCLVFDVEVCFLKMVVGIVLPPRHDDLQMFLNQLNDSSSIFS